MTDMPVDSWANDNPMKEEPQQPQPQEPAQDWSAARGRSISVDRARDQSPVRRSAVRGALNAPIEEAEEHKKNSVQENRVYVSNLAYGVDFERLKEYMSSAGTVVWSEILINHDNRSKGCGIVEFASPDDAQNAIRTLSETDLDGRTIYIREDREAEAKYGVKSGPPPARGGYSRERDYGGSSRGEGGGNLFIGNVPDRVAWQDLKDLFRAAGNVARADVAMGRGRSLGHGTVSFDDPSHAEKASRMFDGYEWQGSVLEVKEDRYIGGGGRGRGYGRSSYRDEPPSYGGRGGYGSRDDYGRDSYDRDGRDGRDSYGRDSYGGRDQYSSGGGYDRPPPRDSRAPREFPPAAPCNQILVRNLPWTTSNEDMVELFETTSQVIEAEVIMEQGTGRSKGMGVTEFNSIEDAEVAIAKFDGYMYGGRPLAVTFNDRQHRFTPEAARSAQ